MHAMLNTDTWDTPDLPAHTFKDTKVSVPVVESACWDTWLDVLAKDFSPSNKVGYVCHRLRRGHRNSVLEAAVPW